VWHVSSRVVSSAFISEWAIPEESGVLRASGVRVCGPWMCCVEFSEFVHHMCCEGIQFPGTCVAKLDGSAWVWEWRSVGGPL
jgi:hypothetical protein